MDINKLKTNLFIVNDFYSQLERLSKAISYYCGLLYYRTDWLEDSIEIALNKPLQQKLLKEITLSIANLGEKDIAETVWTHIKLPLNDIFSTADMIVLEKSIKRMAANLALSISSEDFFMYTATNSIEEKEEFLEEIENEISKLDKQFISTYS